MNNERLTYLTARYLGGTATSEEEKELLLSIQSSGEARAAFRQTTARYRGDPDDAEAGRKWNRLASVIAGGVSPLAEPEKRETLPPASAFSSFSSFRRLSRLSLAAAVLLLCVCGVATMFFRRADTGETAKGEAWLTVAAETEDRTCRLPDGSSVYLRRGAALSYPGVFSPSLRQVSVRGEAFFDVVRDPAKPFRVEAADLRIQVLGTSFSVEAPEQGGTISVTLVEGSVSLNDARQKELVRLRPDQRAEYIVDSGQFTVSEVDSERLTAWRKGVVTYDNASLEEIVRLIEEAYYVALQYAAPADPSQRFSGAFVKTQKLETVLELTGKLTGTKLTVRR